MGIDNSKCSDHLVYSNQDCLGCTGYLGSNEHEIKRIFNEGYDHFRRENTSTSIDEMLDSFRSAVEAVYFRRERKIREPIESMITSEIERVNQ
jgi:hypothetical protein